MRILVVFGMTFLSFSATGFAGPSARQALMNMNEKILGVRAVPLTSMNYIGSTLAGEVCEIAVQKDHLHFSVTSKGQIIGDDAFNSVYGNEGMQTEAKVVKYNIEQASSARIQAMEVEVASDVDNASARFIVSRVPDFIEVRRVIS